MQYNSEIVLRVWDTLAPVYLRAAAYEKYVAGIWKLPAAPEKKLYPARYRVDYAVFESEDSAVVAPNVKSVWVKAISIAKMKPRYAQAVTSTWLSNSALQTSKRFTTSIARRTKNCRVGLS